MERRLTSIGEPPLPNGHAGSLLQALTNLEGSRPAIHQTSPNPANQTILLEQILPTLVLCFNESKSSGIFERIQWSQIMDPEFVAKRSIKPASWRKMKIVTSLQYIMHHHYSGKFWICRCNHHSLHSSNLSNVRLSFSACPR